MKLTASCLLCLVEEIAVISLYEGGNALALATGMAGLLRYLEG